MSTRRGLGRTLSRSAVVALVLGVAVVVADTAAQPARKSARIGVLSGNFPPPRQDACLGSLRRGLSELGYVEGASHVLDVRWAEGRSEPFVRLADELAQRDVDVIVSFTSLGHRHLTRATSRIPIVMAVSTYPVEEGLIASLPRPGGNVTGIAMFTGEIFAKRLQLLREAVTGLTRVGVIRLAPRIHELMVKDLERGAHRLGLTIHVAEVSSAGDLPGAFQALGRAGVGAVMTTQAPFFALNRARIAELALKHRLPSLSGEAQAAEAGILMSYGPDVYEGCRRAATFVDQILKGTKPGDIPVEEPTKFELLVNLRTARALGLTMPPALLLRADQVIE